MVHFLKIDNFFKQIYQNYLVALIRPSPIVLLLFVLFHLVSLNSSSFFLGLSVPSTSIFPFVHCLHTSFRFLFFFSNHKNRHVSCTNHLRVFFLPPPFPFPVILCAEVRQWNIQGKLFCWDYFVQEYSICYNEVKAECQISLCCLSIKQQHLTGCF